MHLEAEVEELVDTLVDTHLVCPNLPEWYSNSSSLCCVVGYESWIVNKECGFYKNKSQKMLRYEGKRSLKIVCNNILHYYNLIMGAWPLCNCLTSLLCSLLQLVIVFPSTFVQIAHSAANNNHFLVGIQVVYTEVGRNDLEKVLLSCLPLNEQGVSDIVSDFFTVSGWTHFLSFIPSWYSKMIAILKVEREFIFQIKFKQHRLSLRKQGVVPGINTSISPSVFILIKYPSPHTVTTLQWLLPLSSLSLRMNIPCASLMSVRQEIQMLWAEYHCGKCYPYPQKASANGRAWPSTMALNKIKL